MRRIRTRATKAELAAIRDIETTSAFEKLDRGEARIVHPRDYPEPLKRFVAREHAMLHIKLSPHPGSLWQPVKFSRDSKRSANDRPRKKLSWTCTPRDSHRTSRLSRYD